MINTTAGPMITSIRPIEVVKISTAPTITGERTYRTASAPSEREEQDGGGEEGTERQPQQRHPVVAERGEELVAQDFEQERERDRDGGDRVAGPVAERISRRPVTRRTGRQGGRRGRLRRLRRGGERRRLVDHRSPF